jgi:hypothetical protein
MTRRKVKWKLFGLECTSAIANSVSGDFAVMGAVLGVLD